MTDKLKSEDSAALPSPCYYQKCLDLCREKGWNATYTALYEDGGPKDGTNWEQMYNEWVSEVEGETL